MTGEGAPAPSGGHERRVLLLALAGPLPAVVIALALLPRHGRWLEAALGALVIGSWLAGAFAVRGRVVRALQTVSGLLAALRQGDFSIRGRRHSPSDALGEALGEVNSLADTLASQRAGALEASALLGKVMAEIDVAVFAFDGE